MKSILLSLLLMVSMAPLHAQTAAPLQSDLPLQYLAQTGPHPAGQPLIIFLHGYGSNETDLFGMRSAFPAAYTYLSVRAPMALGEGSYQWFNKNAAGGALDGDAGDLRASGALILDFIRKATLKYHTTPDKVFLIGFSQGAIMSYEVALRHPQQVRGIAVLSGKIFSVLRGELKPSAPLRRLDVFIGHGTSDERIPYAAATDSVALLNKLGVEPQFHSYFGMPHTVGAEEMTALKSWLQAVTKQE